MDRLKIERLRGGINPLRGRGEIDTARLVPRAREQLEALFGAEGDLEVPGNSPVYRVTRVSDSGTRTIDVPEHLMPEGLVGAVKDELP
jgi:hypothetical protein